MDRNSHGSGDRAVEPIRHDPVREFVRRTLPLLAHQVGEAHPPVARRFRGGAQARFVSQQLDVLPGEPRPGAPRTITDEHVERVVRWTLETKPGTPRTSRPPSTSITR